MMTCINQNLAMESSIPFLIISNYQIIWEINAHARMVMTGNINPNEAENLCRQYMGTEIEFYFLTDSGERDKTIFKGFISSVKFESGYGSCQAVIEGMSASAKLDYAIASCSFQNVSMTYGDLIKKTVSEAGGAVICTAGNEQIKRPILRYRETTWEFAKRMASLEHTFLIPDIMTGRPNLWFGMKKGARILESMGSWDEGTVIKGYGRMEKSGCKTSYRIISRKYYHIGDYSESGGMRCIIYKVRMNFQNGELLFFYYLSRENDLQTQPYFNENFIGMSLLGTVEKTEGENVYLKLDIDKEEGTYPFQWIPETGNTLYAMPEPGAPAALYFIEPDEREAVAVRCIQKSSIHEGNNCQNKKIETTYGDKIHLFPDSIGLSKNDNYSLDLKDKHGVTINSRKKIELKADSKVVIKAKEIAINVPEEINAMVEF